MTQFVHAHYKQAHISCVHACIHTHVLVAHRFGAACSPAGVRTGPSQWELHSGCSRCSTSLEISQQHMHHRLLAPWVQKRDSLQTWRRHERKHKKKQQNISRSKGRWFTCTYNMKVLLNWKVSANLKPHQSHRHCIFGYFWAHPLRAVSQSG